ncbi:MAG: glycosyltransferase [Acidimicrobiia bacterium]
MTVDIVVVTYESAKELPGCLAPLEDPAAVTVVDNASRDAGADLAEAWGARVVRNDTNDGFGAAANAGAAFGTGDYILFLNPDAELRSSDLARLVRELDEHDELAVVGPRLALPDGGWQKPWWPFPSARRSVTEALGLHRLRPEPAPDDHRGFVVGACLLIRRAVFEQLGGFDQRFWLYGEEADLCKRAVDAGWGVRLVEDAIATHIGGASGSAAPQRTFEHFHRGTEHFIAKHEGTRSLLAHRTANVIGQAARMPLLAARRSPVAPQRARQVRRFVRVLREHPATVVPVAEMNNGDRDLVVFSLENWDEIWRRNQFFAQALLDAQPGLRVLFVEPPIDMLHRLRTGATLRERAGLRQMTGDGRLWALRPMKWLPRVAGPWADRSLRRQVRRTMRRLGVNSPTYWVNDTAYAPLIEGSRAPVVYDITDDWLLADTTPRERRRRADRELTTLGRADVVTVCSTALALERGRHRDVRLIPNGVDVDHMRRARPRPSDLPPEPTAVYVGTLHEDRLDVDLVAALAERRPAFNLVFVGPNALSPASIDRLVQHGNVHLLGARPYADVPAYLQHADVLIVPHVVTPFTESLDPIKAYEYAAVGRPVVATPVPGFRGASWARLATSVDDFAARVDEALLNPFVSTPVAGLPSWSNRAAMFAAALDEAREVRSARPLKVAYLDHCAQLSGGELALSRLLPALDRVEPHVILAEEGPLIDRLERAGADVEVLPMHPGTRSLNRGRVTLGALPVKAVANSIGYVFRTSRRLRQIKPDIVHTNSLKAALYGGLAGRLAGVPVVWHVRDRIADDYLPKPAVKLVQAMAKVVPTAVVANSHATLATLEVGKGLQSVVPIPVVYDSVGAVEIDLRLPPAAAGELLFAIVGRIAPWKGQDVFLRAFAKAFPQSGAQALIIGSVMFGETDYEAELHALVDELGIGARIAFTGFQDDVVSWLKNCDAMVHASVIPEPFGQVVVEGMACGLPVIAANAGGPAEVITTEVNGLLVEPADVDALAAAMQRLTDEALRRRLGEHAKRRAVDFSPARVGRQIMDVYDEVLAR